MTDPDDTASFQRAIDSGAEVVYTPVAGGTYRIGSQVRLSSPTLERLVGLHSSMQFYGTPLPQFDIPSDTASSKVLSIEQCSNLRVTAGSSRTLYARDVRGTITTGTASTIFIENATIAPFSISAGQTVYARQLNVEGIGAKITNNGGTLRVLGLKTEGVRDPSLSKTPDGPLVVNEAGATTEILGGLSYTVQSGSLAPMFINRGGTMSASMMEVSFNNDPYLVLVEETRGGVTNRITRAGVAGGVASAPLTALGTGSLITHYLSAP